MEEKKNNTEVTAEILYYLAGAFSQAITGGFLAREHASSIFKSTLKAAGYEVPSKKGKEAVIEK